MTWRLFTALAYIDLGYYSVKNRIDPSNGIGQAPSVYTCVVQPKRCASKKERINTHDLFISSSHCMILGITRFCVSLLIVSPVLRNQSVFNAHYGSDGIVLSAFFE